MTEAFDRAYGLVLHRFTALWPAGSYLAYDFNVTALLATVLVCLVCGAMGALVVGNRMAFFSDALAHCAFAGVGLGLLLCLALRVNESAVREWLTLVMVVFGIGVGLLIAFVRERTGLASDTVIGVFYAGAIGVGAVATRLVASRKTFFDIETFIFGNPLTARPWEILALFVLALLTAGVLLRTYNALILTSFSPSLALSRRVPVRFYQYLLIVLLGLLVNLSLQIVGTLLINGLLIVPAAAAANLARNLRQMFWYSVCLALAAGVGGSVLSWEVDSATDESVKVGTSGAIVLLCVLFFIVSANVGPRLRNRRPAAPLPLPPVQ